MRQHLRVLLVALLVLLAGCSGGVGGDGDGGDGVTLTETTQTTTAAGSNGSTTDSTDTESAKAATELEFNSTWDEQYRAGQYYRYEIESPNLDGTATYEWEIVSVSENNVTIRTTLVTSESTSEQTVTAPADELSGELSGTSSGSVAALGFDSPYYSALDGKTLEVGDGWEASGSNGNVSFAVESTSTHAGLQCADFVVRTNGSVFWESCVAPDSPLPGYVAFYENEGDSDPAFEMTLVEYRPGS
ncbi:hypothetical protein ACH9L7_01635 [Haloferax sp. S1W]|uniref:hypothetical protein n=1 Tax=Haloferax sp. S1W TaxID=3377110 RepID=UPI0037C577EE